MRNKNKEAGSLHSKGFTLLEVMIAVAIVGLVLVSLTGLASRSIQDVALAERITTATLLARRVMIETLMTGKLMPGEDAGDFEEEEYGDYVWRKAIATTPLLTVLEVRVAVVWKEGDREDMVELVTYE